MTGVDYFSWIVFFVILIAVVALFVIFAQMPGKTARERGHPQADAINMCSWLGILLTGGIVWIVAMVWSRMQYVASPVEPDGTEVAALKARIAELEAQVAGGES